MMDDVTPIIRALVDAYWLLECAGDDEIDPRIAVKGMENISSNLLAMEKSEQRALRSILQRIADQVDDQAYSAFARGLPDMIGLDGGTDV